MADDLERLGGRLPLFKPDALTAEQRRLHDDMTASWAPWADKAGFQAKLPDGRFAGRPSCTCRMSRERAPVSRSAYVKWSY